MKMFVSPESTHYLLLAVTLGSFAHHAGHNDQIMAIVTGIAAMVLIEPLVRE